jgi:hypothetical protein
MTENLMPYDDSYLDEDNLNAHTEMFHGVVKLLAVSSSSLL